MPLVAIFTIMYMKRIFAMLSVALVAAVMSAVAGASPLYGAEPFQLRLLNHWDNPDGTVERGYAGRSIWKWDLLPEDKKIPVPDSLRLRYEEYGRLNQACGINGTVLNNVNAKPLMLSTSMLRKTARIADILRPYGIKVYLSVNFASPKALGGLTTADPLDRDVQKWWKKKASEIYKLIPDFGGFLVKANSEGEPGPMDYGRTHVDGANMLARALRPHGGIVMWRAFVYSPQGGDRANQAYDEFIGLDGQFLDNVIIQIKNGPIDFQPREPVSPLFFGLKRTKMMAELQITQEYTGHSVHTCYLAPMWHEFFQTLGIGPADKDVRERLHIPDMTGYFAAPNLVGVAGVANIGDAPNWTANELAMANWWAFGRMASDPAAKPRELAEEFLARHYTPDPTFVKPVAQLLMDSYETVVSYMMPMGLHHIFAGGHHYGPEPWCYHEGWREDWLPRYYHRADSIGLGFNRTNHDEPCLADPHGSANTTRYPAPLRDIYNNVETCPVQFLLWFHHVPWKQMVVDAKGDRTLPMWDLLCRTYQYDGVNGAEWLLKKWREVRPVFALHGRPIDDPAVRDAYEEQLRRFERQARDAAWWRDACLLYFQQFSRLPFPADAAIKPVFSLDELQKFNLRIDNYTAAPIDRLP